MSLAGVPRINSGVELVKEMHQSAIMLAITSSADAHELLAEACRRILQDRPPDQADALSYLGRVQKQVNIVSLCGGPLEPGELDVSLDAVRNCLKVKPTPWHKHQVRGKMRWNGR